MSNTTVPQFKDTLGNLYTIPGATPVPPTPVAPVIPDTAKNTGNILIMPGWKMEKDKGTPGVATNIKMTVNKDGSALFSANQTGKGGVRWSITCVKNVPDIVLNYCYDITLQLADPTQQACIEMDINHVDSKGVTYLLCAQSSHYSKSYEYTLSKNGQSSGFGWHPSGIKSDPLTWPKATDKHIRIFTHRDTSGKVYYDGIEEDGNYIEFPVSTCAGVSSMIPNPMWTKGIILPNFQLDGATASGLMSALVKNFNISYW